MGVFYTGSYTGQGTPAENPEGKGIGCFEFNLETGEITEKSYTKQRNPSYLVISDDKKYLYAVEETQENLKPKVHAYKIKNNGDLRLINSQPISGDYACHLAIIENKLVLASYVSGNILSYPINTDGSLNSYSQDIRHEGVGPNKERQEAAHAHMIYPFAHNQMYAVDLTLDAAKAYQWKVKTKQWESTPNLDIHIASGSGARHMVMDYNQEFAYILGELTGEIFVADLSVGESTIVQNISFIPKNHDGAVGGAAIRLHPNGKFLYASNRGSETIAIFKIDDQSKQLSLVAHQSTYGKTPRDFNIHPEGKWLIAANQDSNSLEVFEINTNDGTLQKKSTFKVNTPVNICWL
ncbi:lactonase family protein [Hyunsoonleella pacifica]|uniref:Lactonase family protein n=1 Tax=Hyunsoonleella pacifica TaxID=1080224 RepID=A0A4Q9FUI4_9FLAO|nr:lactonase family protein [Hyunsoonleella pacifica]TBN18939.1 lactonase family protein [Hyunsoonleella pacifica]GGD06025.1 3-carboxymuconate cyclase [Hyunsoonleella pacifica]